MRRCKKAAAYAAAEVLALSEVLAETDSAADSEVLAEEASAAGATYSSPLIASV